jgi:uracil-DNA glycosylase
LDKDDKLGALCGLRNTWGACVSCPLHESRKNLVFADGDTDADIMLIASAPGEDEDDRGLPFQGKTGGLLEDILTIAGIDHSAPHMTNLVMCRPPENRDPYKPEIDACWPRLLEQIRIVDPLLIMAAGRVAAQKLTGNRTLAVTKERGSIYDVEFQGLMGPYVIPVMAVIHPAACLRNPDMNEGGDLADTIKDFRQADHIVRLARKEWSRA